MEPPGARGTGVGRHDGAMTSTSALAPAALRAVPTEPDPIGDGSPRRRRTRFPDASSPRAAEPAAGGSAVLWQGRSPALREQLADHAAAVGLTFLDDSPAGAGGVCAIVAEGPPDGEVPSSGEAPDAAVAPGGAPPLLLLTAAEEIPGPLWREALAHRARAVLRLPQDSEALLAHLAELSRPRGSSLLLGVVGGCGGAGASSLAARLAAAARSDGPVVLVDADPLGSGLDLLVEAPPLHGITWHEAERLGPDDGEALRSGLPLVDDVRLLVAAEERGPTPETVRQALASLAPLAGTVIADLAPAMVRPLLDVLDHLLVVVPARDGAVRAAARRLDAWAPQAARTGLVVRRERGPSPREIAADLDLPLRGSFRDSPRGDVPLLDVRRRGADRTARELLPLLREEARR